MRFSDFAKKHIPRHQLPKTACIKETVYYAHGPNRIGKWGFLRNSDTTGWAVYESADPIYYFPEYHLRIEDMRPYEIR